MQKLQKLDFFSQQFSFLVGPQKKKKTSEGGLYTVVAFSLSLGYLIYLLVFYFTNQFLPKITSKIKNQTNLQDITFNESVFGFTFSSNGQTLQQLQQSTGKQYLIFKAQYASIALQQQNYYDLPITYCTDQNFQGYLCLDFNNMSDVEKTLFTDPTSQSISQFVLTVQPCTGLPNCASPAEIQSKIIDSNFQFYLKIRIIQYNEQSQKYEEGFQIDLIQFDDNLALQNQYQLTQSITTVNQGFLFQTTSVSKFISGYQKSSSYYTLNNLLQKAGFTGYAQFVFQIQQNQEINQIQYPLITEALAQFMPIVNILFTIGILTRLFSESKIVENINTLYLKEYYRSTALKLLSNEKKNKNLKSYSSDNKNNIIEQNQINQKSDQTPLESNNLNSETKKNSNNLLTADQIIDTQKQIDETVFLNEEKSKFQANFFQFYKQYFFGNLIKQTSQKEAMYQKMCNFTKKSIDIFELYRNLMRVNKAIKMLMSKEQYAALQFCGCEMDLDQIDFEKSSTSAINNNQKLISQINDNQNSNNNHPNNQAAIYPTYAIDIEEGKIQQKTNLNEEKNSLTMSAAGVDNGLSIKKQAYDSYKTQLSKYKEQQLSQKKNDNQSIDSEIQQSLSNSNQINNHLQQQEEILSNKSMLHFYLNKFIDKINKNQNLTQIDLNIYSSLIGRIAPSQEQEQVYNIN
ncbi:transmembrane protein, putative (macronuclear) [Tetrahymena thermophila SB210]|uniref:Transmembrane protein, putative n=1 Tax=Tetrahymena thermophila (strain SB210) TaxID=312017 RepID=W7X795_TETTS|nr:transmembrane protein, putative [Tetrahymena thermophila SB210]EWS75265.1 transmembrane protein, putative [Tetrahymena thermophila SB210]|eukprot:XP_012652256.1 transmembrane protein, putative [Tetrahymena thermophila SB210]